MASEQTAARIGQRRIGRVSKFEPDVEVVKVALVKARTYADRAREKRTESPAVCRHPSRAFYFIQKSAGIIAGGRPVLWPLDCS